MKFFDKLISSIEATQCKTGNYNIDNYIESIQDNKSALRNQKEIVLGLLLNYTQDQIGLEIFNDSIMNSRFGLYFQNLKNKTCTLYEQCKQTENKYKSQNEERSLLNMLSQKSLVKLKHGSG